MNFGEAEEKFLRVLMPKKKKKKAKVRIFGKGHHYVELPTRVFLYPHPTWIMSGWILIEKRMS